MSRWTKLRDDWKDCERCDLCERRKKVVLFKGKIPCDILFIGEAPGINEDVLGKPFVGPAGKLLDDIIEQAALGSFRLGFTNLVGCIPKDENGQKTKEPSKDSIAACKERVDKTIEVCNPDLVVRVGKLSQKHVTSKEVVDVIHPAAILRSDIAQKGLLIQKTIAELSDAVELLVPF